MVIARIGGSVADQNSVIECRCQVQALAVAMFLPLVPLVELGLTILAYIWYKKLP